MTWHFVDRGFVPGIQACAYVSLFTVTEPGRTGREIWDMGHLDIVHGGGYAKEWVCRFFIPFIYLVNDRISIRMVNNCAGGILPGSHQFGVSLVFLSDFNLEVL